jgi:hypothetical protein
LTKNQIYTFNKSKKTFILQPEFDYCCFPFLDNCKKEKYLPLAPIEVEILVCRGSAQKIETDSGTILPKMPNASAPKLIDRNPLYNNITTKNTKPTV